MKILIIDDDHAFSAYVGQALQQDGHVIDIARDGVGGLQRVRGAPFDLVLIDSALPDMNTFELLSQLRRHDNLFIMMLSRDARIDVRVRSLREGADDYLLKPLSLSELLARVFALGRRNLRHRANSEESGLLKVADLELDLFRRRVSRNRKRIDLTAKEYSLLALMMRKRGEVLSRLVLAEQVWDMKFKSNTNVVEVAIRRLRSKVDDPFPRRLLHTVRGMGYVLEDRGPVPESRLFAH
ncbi:winged helix-turn-helix domain-containing protein [Bordetella genomosp. 13]|uniref:DNA-binding response regulator n=1 Tax=Bordetella genomosp. 13 TaxID=463040 RepID=A0A1W6ZD57_9BORD|nr:winged helix-turn-helix domain-containing protein [Bordetella genomosp. 13]ARP95237.1 DNA-binding response regulator [Bordetella genomosp. 13]